MNTQILPSDRAMSDPHLVQTTEAVQPDQAPGAPGRRYIGRFAPSPTGPLHAGSLVAALASWLDARAHRGSWLVRIEDVDTPRCRPAAATQILAQLAACGLRPDAAPLYQSSRGGAYALALDALLARGWAFRCSCTRRQIEALFAVQTKPRERHTERIYPGTCRDAGHAEPRSAIRLLAAASTQRPLEALHIEWRDRRLGTLRQDVTVEVGDFVLRRADGLWAYQLAVVVDDAAQGITHIVRGADLADNTPRQIHLQRVLGVATPAYLHVPLLLGADGEKLSKRNGARAVDVSDPARAVRDAAAHLGLVLNPGTLAQTLDEALAGWKAKWVA
ncbi:MAG: tRNA glutamyl-Q(34) synthetase GluQRS [Burkholderiaceae bacterium]